jgi:hypothetical protein
MENIYEGLNALAAAPWKVKIVYKITELNIFPVEQD